MATGTKIAIGGAIVAGLGVGAFFLMRRLRAGAAMPPVAVSPVPIPGTGRPQQVGATAPPQVLPRKKRGFFGSVARIQSAGTAALCNQAGAKFGANAAICSKLGKIAALPIKQFSAVARVSASVLKKIPGLGKLF
jgi:hypothetical protein